MKAITVRLSPDAYRAVCEIAYDNCVSKAEIVRMAMMGNLSRYLGDIRIIDKAESAELKGQIVRLMDATSRVEKELHRIGVNYNQEIKLKNIEHKRGIQTTGNKGMAFPGQEIDKLISEYRQAVKQAGDVLCRILM